MLIPITTLHTPKKVTGILHIGAHECEERKDYLNRYDITDDDIVWVDALQSKVDLIKRTQPTVKIYNACLTDKDGDIVDFMVTNNGQSSSVLNFGTHSVEHPHVVEVGRIKMSTVRLDTFMKNNGLSMTKYNFMNIDVQGAELLVLKGGPEVLESVDYIYLEINEKELYKGCALLPELNLFLESTGFKLQAKSMTSHGWGDAFYVREK